MRIPHLTRRQYVIGVGSIVGLLAVAFVAASVFSVLSVDETEIADDQTTRAIQEIIAEVRIPIEFLQDGPLQDFTPYEQITLPERAGRANPFSPAPQDAEGTESAESGEEDQEGV